MKEYILPSLYRGIAVFKTCCAESDKKAAEKFGVSTHQVRKYANKVETDGGFGGVMAYMDSGKIIFEYNRRDLFRRIIPLVELEEIIDSYRDKESDL